MVATIDDQAVGFIELIVDDGYIDCCYIAPTFQRQGIGRLLLQHAINTAKSHGLSSLTVYASDVALPLFARIGFCTVQRQEQLHDGVTMHNTLMRYALPDD